MQKKSSEPHDRSFYQNILNLMLMYPSLRVAYIDEREETMDGKFEKKYYSVLVKGGDKLDEEIYRIRLPGKPTDIGEGKPNCHVFMHACTVMCVRVLFHYVHPDISDRLFHITRGVMSKASKGINLSEDIFAGYNSTLLGGNVTHHEYMQMGKGRDVGMNQISLFEAKVANRNGEQTLSRDVYRLGRRFDFYRMLSFYFTTVGFYFSSMVRRVAIHSNFQSFKFFLDLSDKYFLPHFIP